jgi:alpha,alpha-trehalase
MKHPSSLITRAGLCLAMSLCAATAVSAPDVAPQPPSIEFAELFAAVQRAGIYADGKSFPDATPKALPAEILAAYRREKASAGFDLRAFTQRYFSEAQAPKVEAFDDARANVCKHIDNLWSVLTRGPDTPTAGSSLLPLPHRYVVPGGRFREVYYWDSYFTMLGLEASGRHDLVLEMVDNFAWLIDTYGHIPNGNRTYYLSRSQPPFFATMVALVAERDGDSVYAKYLPQLEREYQFWMEGGANLARGKAHRRVVRLGDGTLLNRYWDDRSVPRDESFREDEATARASGRPAGEVYRSLRAAAESGWDFSSRWLADGKSLATIHTTDFLPVDLNSLLYQTEISLSLGYAAKGDTAAGERARAAADTRAAAIRRVFWNEKRRTFTDYLWNSRTSADLVTAAGLFPLYFGIAEPAQATQVANTTRVTLLRPEGIVPTVNVSGQQWDAPNGWAPLQWIAIRGFAKYGEKDLSQFVSNGWVRENVSEFGKSGKLVEKYDVTGDASARGGEYPNQDGFGWTNGVLRALSTTAEFASVCGPR